MGVLRAIDEQVDHRVVEDRPTSCGHLLKERVATSPESDGYLFFRGDTLERRTWRQTWDEVGVWAAGLVDLGIEVGDRVSILAETRIEWVWANWGIMLAGAATTTVYATSSAEAAAFIVADSGSRIVFAADHSQVEKLRARRHELPEVVAVVVFDSIPQQQEDDWVVSLTDFLDRGRRRRDAETDLVERRLAALTPDSPATIIYTSGTTGHPKGAELAHDSLVYEGTAVAGIDILSEADLQYLWLPLAHVFGNVLIMIAAATGSATCVDGRVDRIVPNLAVVRPTWMGAAPRIFEKAYAAVSATLGDATGAKAKLVAWALGVGRRVAQAQEQGRPVGRRLAAQHRVADRLVLGKVRERFGGRVRFFISGSARLDPELSWWFAGVGMQIIEGYGLTETSAAACVNRPRPGAHRHGSVGWPLPGTEVRVAEDGELLVRGPGVMRRYHGRPDATAEAFTPDGFFRTGDVATIDDRGFVTITDRKKDVFKTSAGKYVSPAAIESRFKAICPYVGQFVVAGEGRNYATALVSLDPDAMAGWARDNGEQGEDDDYATLVRSEPVRRMVQGYVDELNAGLERWETIKRFEILDRDLTIEAGDLTPSLKLRRRVVVDKFSDVIDDLYAS